MTRAIELAGLQPTDIDHVNAHATGTSVGDVAEGVAINRAMKGHKPAVYAPKSALGHSVGAVGAVESILTVLALRDGIIPPTLNLKNLDPEIDLDVVAGEPRTGDFKYAINNSFGFGGHNVAPRLWKVLTTQFPEGAGHHPTRNRRFGDHHGSRYGRRIARPARPAAPPEHVLRRRQRLVAARARQVRCAAAAGTVNGVRTIAFCTDGTVMGGAMGVEGCQHIVDAYDTAIEEQSPIVSIWHSGGARLAEGVKAQHAVGLVFEAMIRASGYIPQISVVVGFAAGGAAYGPALTDVIIMAPDSKVFVTGPDVVRSVTGEDVDMVSLGGPEAHTRSPVFATSSPTMSSTPTSAAAGWSDCSASRVISTAARPRPATST
jgi:acetyl-CoA/propionyl-CoA carboxylase carboxyl transferase subunit